MEWQELKKTVLPGIKKCLAFFSSMNYSIYYIANANYLQIALRRMDGR
jgi:hypothetical protein